MYMSGKLGFLAMVSFFLVKSVSAQTTPSMDVPTIPNAAYAVMKYDSILQTELLTYQYKEWDFDGDHINDELIFIGNGGAHTYFYPVLRLSTQKESIAFTSFFLDMPYPVTVEERVPSTQVAIITHPTTNQKSLYLHIDSQWGSIPKILKAQGVATYQLLISCEKGAVVVKDAEL